MTHTPHGYIMDHYIMGLIEDYIIMMGVASDIHVHEV